MWKPILIIIVLFAALGYGYRYFTTPVVSDKDPSAVVTDTKPLQSSLLKPQNYELDFGNLKVTLQVVARYKISAKLLAKKRYVDGWAGKLVPYDLVLGWKQAAIQNNVENLPISQSVRWYQYMVSPASNMTSAYIATHTSNNHIIPATKNIQKAIRSLKVYDELTLEGYLVDMTGHFKANRINWFTSTSRDDTGSTAGELFYVTSVKVGDKVYK